MKKKKFTTVGTIPKSLTFLAWYKMLNKDYLTDTCITLLSSPLIVRCHNPMLRLELLVFFVTFSNIVTIRLTRR